MQIMFVEAQKKLDNLIVNSINSNVLPEQVFIAYSIQYKEIAEKLRKKLRKEGKEIVGFKQVLGCSQLKSKAPILLVGSGKFHAIQLALQDNQIYILDGDKINQLSEKEIGKIKAKRKAALSCFLSAEKIGILVSCKPGQENFKEAIKLKKQLEKKGKEARVFIADNINTEELENYDIESWVNTACPALSLDSRIINMRELKIQKY